MRVMRNGDGKKKKKIKQTFSAVKKLCEGPAKIVFFFF